jgi:hypothetical protein
MNFKLEMMVFGALVIPTLLDGCELWGEAMNKLSYEQESFFGNSTFTHEILANTINDILSLLGFTHSFHTNSILQTNEGCTYLHIPLGRPHLLAN